MSGKKNRRAPSATPWDDLPESQITPSQAIVKAARDGICSFRRERFSGDADFFNGYPRSECPRCGSAKAKRDGANRNGVQVYRCLFCGRTSTPRRRHHLRRLEAAGRGVGRLHLAGSPSRARPTTPSCSRNSQTSSTRSSRSTARASC
ncbi:transposase [Senegalimassilia faecalis]